ncbi:hypothetical protein PBY51_001150 [Eleginops maclovinus]|uniref:Uncharacterized protein n=1 Tax=Eleginops maclovinus TaxID=56733 RepID=A0AAN7XQW2_ELEMC|nr:hypothetical protein PBY51_001150 [Eleginops maclovinus]
MISPSLTKQINLCPGLPPLPRPSAATAGQEPIKPLSESGDRDTAETDSTDGTPKQLAASSYFQPSAPCTASSSLRFPFSIFERFST